MAASRKTRRVPLESLRMPSLESPVAMAAALREALQTGVDGARGQAKDALDGLEAFFQARVQRAMHQLGVPTAEEIRALTQRVAELNETVRRLDARAKPAGRAATRRRVVAKRTKR